MKSHGTGLPPWDFCECGSGVVIEHGALVFHPETLCLGDDIYIGHYAIVKGYYNSRMTIGRGTWIGQHAFLHSAAGIVIGEDVGMGPGAKILTSVHDLNRETHLAIMKRPLQFAAVEIGDGCDLGVNSVILPGVQLGCRVQVAAGAVVTTSFPDDTIVAGVPARGLAHQDSVAETRQ